MSETLSNNIKERRARASMTQAELADACSVSRKTINTVENGVFVPSTILALKIAAVFGVPVEQIFWLES
ncbi:MAG: helix-turn-helix transcriptional regulator [Erythrobacter sp.]|nr:helix-turn-helix transcriptional regulator [Erythrobacter sp.]NNC47599.1 helix-turn-helix transcriptional regulator [Sphingomonas sp.]RZV51012.1 MAG: transcriptional regulator [Sphingomonadaceae bacterium]